MNKISRVLLVCLGNTARSPAAEYLARYYAKEKGVSLTFESAGFINAFSYMQPESQEYLNARGIDHSDFRPQIINRNLLEKHDLIITMERTHVSEIKSNYPGIIDIDKKTSTLKEFNDDIEEPDIIDPYYTSSATYKKVLEIIDENIEKMINKIIQINQ
ncbi:MAG: arsenate reductase/protein-tyrosine-phosphatase family protein [Promethearchaeota archaeon]|jgi:protein-tyrosine phosphatase